MLSKQVYSEKTVALEDLFPNFTHEFLEPFKEIVGDKIKLDLHLDFQIKGRKHAHKINPILRLARPEDAEKIIEIYKELYDGTYPYKEMEDVHEVRKMIEDPKVQWIIYQDPSENIAGCITFVLDFENKRGYIRGFMLRKKYQGHIDITKAMISSMLGMLHKYKNVIYVWYVENRTAHAKSQYSMYVCGISPIGFYPNKDIFCGEVESDIMQILYDEKALTSLRSREIPQLIPQVEPCFQFSCERYGLESLVIKDSKMSLDRKLVKALKKSIYGDVSKDSFGYETFTFRFHGSDSFFQFLYTPQVKNFEKVKYKVESREELHVFAKEFLKCKKELSVRYCEVFVSAYNRDHQQIFWDVGFKPRGYIPSWEYSNTESMFKDSILFSIFDGKISGDIQLIDQGYKLIEMLGMATISSAGETIPQRKKNVTKVVSSVLSSKKVMKNSLRTSMAMYLVLLAISLLVAIIFGDVGFNLTKHTISDLGNSLFTPAPFLFDTACGLAGAVTVPNSYYIYNIVKKENSIKGFITRIGLLSGIIGGVGYICVGVFSLERSGPNGIIHGISAIIAFTGFVFSILFFSIPALLQKNIAYKIFGISGIITPSLLLLLNGILATPLLEWLLLFSILFHIVPLNYRSVST